MQGVQCYELFGGIALTNHTFSFSLEVLMDSRILVRWTEIIIIWEIFVRAYGLLVHVILVL